MGFRYFGIFLICNKGPLGRMYPFEDYKGSHFWRDRTNLAVYHQDRKICNKNFKTRKKRKEEEKRLTFLALVNNRQRLCIIGLPAPKLVLLATRGAENNERAHILLFFFCDNIFV